MYENDVKKELESPFYDTYEIKKGDSLYQISKKYNVNTKLLAELNGLDMDDYIYPGQIIFIPKKNVSYYITKEGDSLNNVSDIFGVSAKKIIDENKTIYLSPGQMIYFIRD